MKVIIDRFEGDIAVLECNGEMLNAPAKLFENAKEGDHIEICIIQREKDVQSVDAQNGIQDARADILSQKTDAKDEEVEDTKSIFERLRKKSKKAKEN